MIQKFLYKQLLNFWRKSCSEATKSKESNNRPYHDNHMSGQNADLSKNKNVNQEVQETSIDKRNNSKRIHGKDQSRKLKKTVSGVWEEDILNKIKFSPTITLSSQEQRKMQLKRNQEISLKKRMSKLNLDHLRMKYKKATIVRIIAS